MTSRSGAAEGPPEGYVLLGRLGKTFGLKGALHFRSLGLPESEALFELEEVFVTGLGVLAIAEVKPHGASLLVSFEGIRRVEEARPLVNAQVYAEPASLPPPAEGGQYADALRGLPVLVDGRPFGTVADLAGVAGAELLTVERPEGGEALIPLRAPYVQVARHEVLVEDPPPGLIDPNEQL
ncbi:MAG TPA: ribosome maturation factor RimM [Trueperaceae bacterium]